MENTQVTTENTGVSRPTGTYVGLLISVAIGFVLYYGLQAVQSFNGGLSYNDVVAKAGTDFFYKILWFLMNFTEATFYAGVFAGLFVILGGFIAWRLDVSRSKYRGFDICYGSNMWPWVFASQVLSMFFVLFVFNYTGLFAAGKDAWLPTFITVVGAPPALMLIYGPNWRVLLLGSFLGGLISFPIAYWLSTKIIPVLAVPGVVANVTTMAITGIFLAALFKVLPWTKKMSMPKYKKTTPQAAPNNAKLMATPTWFVRRVFADFSEAQFYGNEIAGAFVVMGVVIDFIINAAHPVYGNGNLLPGLLLSQFIAASFGVLFHYEKFVETGWYGTYIPVVSVGPACVLMYGGSIGVAVFSGIMGALIAPPFAEYVASKLPEDFHPTIANVTSMAASTIVVATIIQVLPWF